ncbi:hypothetical protein GCM10025868_40680 [Angustibacter aerolatus]|uniref:Uncharacterized protein n=1 Tax=Angustibacter aerolatus TaxID=1162965 RepID=A0ABQ6JN67_9ACTN|nr:hypothetical protein GCM10025868_40680 [Angustibacter aerolatus]
MKKSGNEYPSSDRLISVRSGQRRCQSAASTPPPTPTAIHSTKPPTASCAVTPIRSTSSGLTSTPRANECPRHGASQWKRARPTP